MPKRKPLQANNANIFVVQLAARRFGIFPESVSFVFMATHLFGFNFGTDTKAALEAVQEIMEAARRDGFVDLPEHSVYGPPVRYHLGE